MATSSRTRPRRVHGNANSEALAVVSGAAWDSAMVSAGQPALTSTCAVIGPAGNSPGAWAVTRIESPGRIVGNFAGWMTTFWPKGPVTVTVCVASWRTLPVLAMVKATVAVPVPNGLSGSLNPVETD